MPANVERLWKIHTNGMKQTSKTVLLGVTQSPGRDILLPEFLMLYFSNVSVGLEVLIEPYSEKIITKITLLNKYASKPNSLWKENHVFKKFRKTKVLWRGKMFSKVWDSKSLQTGKPCEKCKKFEWKSGLNQQTEVADLMARLFLCWNQYKYTMTQSNGEQVVKIRVIKTN